MNFSVPKEITDTINTLENAGFEAYIVGGCVRDALLGKTPQDYDITTSATPENVISLFSHTIPTGLKHGTVTVIFENDEKTEITTFRSENGYSDNRHPESVCFVKTVEEDLSRRDFTVNAMAYSKSKGLKDPFGGLQDLKAETLRAVGNPRIRFSEDALRIMRLFRFSAQLGFEIENNTFTEALKLAPNLATISRERIREEMIKTLCGQNPQTILPLIKTDCLAFLGISKKVDNFGCLQSLPASPASRFSVFCFKNNLNPFEISQNLRFSKAFSKTCENICRLLKGPIPESKAEIKRLLSCTNEADFKAYLDILACFNNIDNIVKLFNEILDNNEPYRIEQLAINGNDLLKLGLKNKEIKKALEMLLNFVIETPEANKTEVLKNHVTK